MARLFLTITESGQNAEIFERRGVAFDFAAGGDLLEQPAHDFAERVFGRASAKRMSSGLATGPISLATWLRSSSRNAAIGLHRRSSE